MKKVIALVLALTMVFALCACGKTASDTPAADSSGPAPASEPIKVRIASQFGDEHPQSVAIAKFKELLEERSNGAFAVELYTNNQLGAAEVWQDMMLEGSIEMSFPGGNIASYYGLTSVTECPFLFTSWDEARYIFTETDICDEINAAMPGAIGVRSIGSLPIGFRVTTSNKEIKSAADYNGLRIRVPNVDYCVWEFEALKSSIIAMNFAELFTALEQGSVDAQENPYSTIESNSLYEVQKYLFDSKHMFTAHFWYVNEAWWQALTEEQRTMVQECVDEACDYGWDLAISEEESTIKALEDAGMQITYPTDEQRAELKQIVSDYVWPKFFEVYEGSEEYINMIQAALEAR